MIEANSVVWTLAYGGSAGFGLGFAFLVVRWLAVFIAGRVDKREAQIDAGTALLIRQLQEQVAGLIEYKKTVDAALRECLERDLEKEYRIAQLEGMIHGTGDARQYAQLIVSADKASDKAKAGKDRDE